MGKRQDNHQGGQQSKTDVAIALANTKLNATVRKQWITVVSNPDLKWESERSYVLQILERNEFLASVFINNPLSAITALQDAAALGLSLSPTMGHCYLIPQRPAYDKPYEVQLKVSYKGMEQAVLRSGSVAAIWTERVFSNDKFDYGMNIDGPFLNFSMSLSDRGELLGVFCMAKLANGEKHVEWMPTIDIEACAAMAAKQTKTGELPATWSGPFRPEMEKKSCVRRASKHWPSTPVLERIMKEFDRENPMTFAQIELDAEDLITDEQIAEMDKALDMLSEKQRAVWYQRKAKAEGYDDIRSVPAMKYEAFRDGLVARMKQMANLNELSKQTIQTAEESTDEKQETPSSHSQSAQLE